MTFESGEYKYLYIKFAGYQCWYQCWYKGIKRHRINGPAYIGLGLGLNGCKYWYVDGKYMM